MKYWEVFFPSSEWILKIEPIHDRVYFCLHWRNKAQAAHIADYDADSTISALKDVIAQIEKERTPNK